MFGPLTLDSLAQKVTMHDTPIELTAYEYRVLEYLIVRAGQVVSKAELTEHIYDQDFDRDSNVIEVFVGRLRRKLDPENTLNVIETLRGRGYCFGLQSSTDND
jgi:two-component system response regulator PhoP